MSVLHYLECVALLSYLLKKLQADKRVQVPVSILNDVMTVLIGVNKKLENELDNQRKSIYPPQSSKDNNKQLSSFMQKRLEEKKQNSIKLLDSFTQVNKENRHVLAEAYQKVYLSFPTFQEYLYKRIYKYIRPRNHSYQEKSSHYHSLCYFQ